MKQGILPRAGLSPQELEEVRKLWEVCNSHDHIEIKLNWSTLSDRPSGVTNDFLFYQNDRIVGFLAIYCFMSTEVEISGMVHPEARRQGIFGQMVQNAIAECRRREVPKLIFINERGSESGKAFLTNLGAAYSFSEYVMELQEQEAETPQALDLNDNIVIRLADVQDTELLVKLNMSGFDMSESDTREYVTQTITGAKERTWIAELGEKREPIGKVGAMVEAEENGFIYGFCVVPAYRGKGYGRRILSQTITELKQQDHASYIKLEVSVENEKALGLYESCGFKTKNANDYYVLLLS
ncbi:ribosomal protein S18 acetylase RimI-like enzyme [Paenibacillus sp. V4I3]|uniref:GNAT family N-acetyltransferase n=1 Tax=unclassified Paenibacillus TaxID=185978 RepID=UPI0027850E13|nr:MULTISPECIES: GNAT family N-acetyltransferase [unclassified Paenibacillus]MDQ0872530.1 ribosomal protein S18 acetylase RimI-like enzyme [Paenibacillus sp. V4I3]MDQ0891585.1 ribosomal protein S18 acetylase RimI-like enzyme [Paenibacillus sp. V4I9]